MAIYDNNMAAIKEKDYDLYTCISEWKERKDGRRYETDQAVNGMPVLYTEKDGNVIYLGSRYDPEHEAERYILQYKNVMDYSFMFFFGLGNGMIAEKMLDDQHEHIKILIYEPSDVLFLWTLEHYDISGLIGNPQALIVVKGMNDSAIEQKIHWGIDSQNYRMCRFRVLPMYEKLFEEDIEKIHHTYTFSHQFITSNIATAIRFGKSLTYNQIRNLRQLFTCNCEEDFEGVFPIDRPAIIVAAGPSLEKNVHVLKEAKGKFLIIAVDTAVPYLVEKGIRPDLAMIVDGRKPGSLFEAQEARKIPLAITSEANCEIADMMESKVVIVSSESEYYNRVFQLAGRTMFHLKTGGSVATSAFVLALAWGYRKIVLVGQDLAISPDKVHAGEVEFGQGRMLEDKIEVDGYYGEKVYTLYDYNFYREWYELAIRGDENLEVINATEGGAKIAGSKQMTLKEVVEEYSVEPFDFEKAICEMPYTFSGVEKDQVIQMWKNSLDILEQLKRKLYEGEREAKSGIKLMSGKQYTKSKVSRIQRRLARIVEECNSKAEIEFLNDITSEDTADVLGDLYLAKEDNDEEVCRVFEKLAEYMKTMHDSVDEVKELLANLISDMER